MWDPAARRRLLSEAEIYINTTYMWDPARVKSALKRNLLYRHPTCVGSRIDITFNDGSVLPTSEDLAKREVITTDVEIAR
jgi:hypothetical protein